MASGMWSRKFSMFKSFNILMYVKLTVTSCLLTCLLGSGYVYSIFWISCWTLTVFHENIFSSGH